MITRWNETIIQIYLDTPTHCPVEWNLIPAADWSATLSVAYHKPNPSATGVSFSPPKPIGNTCSSPSQLVSLLKRAEILTFYPGIDMAHIFTLNESTVSNILASSPRMSGGMIHITLKYPGVVQRITIVDVPGRFLYSWSTITCLQFTSSNRCDQPRYDRKDSRKCLRAATCFRILHSLRRSGFGCSTTSHR